MRDPPGQMAEKDENDLNDAKDRQLTHSSGEQTVHNRSLMTVRVS